MQKYIFFLILSTNWQKFLIFLPKKVFVSEKMSNFATLLLRRMNSKVLIIGNHPVIADVTKQYRQRGDAVLFLKDDQELSKVVLAAFKEVVLLADYYKSPIEADNRIMGTMQQIAASYNPEGNNGKRLLCHLLLRSHSLLHMIRLDGFCEEIEKKLEVNPFTMEDQWSQTVALSLDREPITKQSEKTVHLVIFGMSDVAEQVAINAAHVCHFPNYLQKAHTLRTRITLIDEAAYEKSSEWLQKYKHLFDNSFYRHVDPKRSPAVTHLSKPMYQDREDFVDVEWEFVSASPYDKLVREKIAQWSVSHSQLLTIVFAEERVETGIRHALHLPEAAVSAKIPVYVYMQNDEAFNQIMHSGNTPNIIPFGMLNHGYDVNIPLVRMAKNVNYIYDRCYEENEEDWDGHLRFSVAINEEAKERLWTKKFGVKRMSNIYNAMTIGVKMRSMGFKENEWDRFYDLSQEDIELLAEVEHNRWSVEELILGFRPCNDSELKEIASSIDAHNKKRIEEGYDAVRNKDTLKDTYKKEKKVHYDLRAYSELCLDGTGRPVQVYDRCLSACIPLIAKESKGCRL